MSRYMAGMDLLLRLKSQAWARLLNDERDELQRVLDMPENEGDRLSREVGEMYEEAIRMANG